MRSSLIGDRQFYRSALAVALPIMVQNFITSFVSMLDNLMVGQIGTVQMSGVAIVNQVNFVLNLCIFGAVSGVGIFTAQFAGSGDQEGVRQTVRFKALACGGLAVLGVILMLFRGRDLVLLYLRGEGSVEDAEATLAYGLRYLRVILWEIPPRTLALVYCSTLRECGETKVPMFAGVAAVIVNLVLNWLLIFDHFGRPGLGVEGAALATVISRFVELAIAVVWTHAHTDKMPFARGLYRSFHIPGALAGQIFRKGMPLLVNEGLWAGGIALQNQCYSLRSLDVIAAVNICMTIWNAASIASMAMGVAVGIIVGQMLGAERPKEEILDTDRKLIAFSVAVSTVFALVMASLSTVFPRFYNTTDAVRDLAAQFILVMAVQLPFSAYTNGAYFTLRSGGKTIVTFLFDSCFVWGVCVPLAYVLSRFTALPILPLYIICNATEAVKCVLGGVMLRRGDWMVTLVK